jgi:ADP-ribose pyrophosphatase YjhB (NUDIX family)
MPWLSRLDWLTRPLFQTRARLTRGLTLGVRALVVDAEGRVLLLRHTYTPGWHMPGGGVEIGETCETAIVRELVEEAGVETIGRPRLLSIHSSHAYFRGDHILFYRIDDWRPVAATSRGEIHELKWFAADDLPAGATEGTRRRIAEAIGGADIHPLW